VNFNKIKRQILSVNKKEHQKKMKQFNRIEGSPSVDVYVRHYGGKKVLKGHGGPFGQIFAGSRFQRGAGVGSFFTALFRGVNSLINRTPDWVKTGAKVVGESALRNIADYGGDVEAGIDKKVAKKRAMKGFVSDLLEQGGKRMKGSGGSRPGKCLKGRGKNGRKATEPMNKKKQKKKCCSLKLIGKGKQQRKKKRGKKTIKRRTKFDLLS
jgi:hypothetical protein